MNAEELARDAAICAKLRADDCEHNARRLVEKHGENEFATELRKVASSLRLISRVAASDARRLARKAP